MMLSASDIHARGWSVYFPKKGTRFRYGAAKDDGPRAGVCTEGDSFEELLFKVNLAEALFGMWDRGINVLAPMYVEFFGHPPTLDALDRVNCKIPGEVGHFFCGVCLLHASPRFVCGCAGSAT